MQKGKAIKALAKKAKKGFRSYPVVYGPTDKKATKLVVGIVHEENAEPEEIKKWYSDDDVMKDPDVLEEVHEFIKEHGGKVGWHGGPDHWLPSRGGHLTTRKVRPARCVLSG